MEQESARTGQDDEMRRRADANRAAWDMPGYTAALDASVEPARHIAYGQGRRLRLAASESELELYPERGVVRFANLAEGVEVTLVGQTTPPTVTPDGLVFEGTNPTRRLSVGRTGSATLWVEQAGARSIDAQPPAVTEPTDRILPSPARPIVQADAAPAPPPRETKEQARGRIEGILVYDPVFTVSSHKQKELVRFTVAEHYTDADGEPQTVYHRCVAFNSERKRLADQVRDQAKQGDAIVVHGAWHDVDIHYRNGSAKQERQLWAYGLKITPQADR